MNLNESMVNLYKQRNSLNKKRSLINNNNKSTQSKSGETDRGLKNETPINDNASLLDATKRQDQQDLSKKQPTTTIDLLNCSKASARFDQLHGCDSIREEIVEIVEDFRSRLDEISEDAPILICGPSGLGKTSLIEAAANHFNLNLIKIPIRWMVENLQSWNEFKENLEHLVRHCLSNEPAIVLIDDLDKIMEKEDHRNRICGIIRRFLGKKLLVFCSSATNDMSDIEFLCTLQLKRPSLEARSKILKSLCECMKLLERFSNDDIQTMATNTPSFTALDLRKMLRLSKIKSRGKPTMKHCDVAIDIVKQSFKKGTYLVEDRPPITWADIGGMSKVRKAFSNILKQISLDEDCKSAGIALYGPPGCGKTMVAQAMANEAGFNFISIKPAELFNKYLGETEKNIRRVFTEARVYEPCIIYIDEFDGLCGTRGNKDSPTSAIQTLLSEMDGFAGRGRSIVVVSTNRIGDIDPAMLRPGRLSKKIQIDPPDEKERLEILDILLKKRRKVQLSLDGDVDLNQWAKKTEGFTGADLRQFFDDTLIISRDYANGIDIELKQVHLEQAMKEMQQDRKELDKKIRLTNCDIGENSYKRPKVN